MHRVGLVLCAACAALVTLAAPVAAQEVRGWILYFESTEVERKKLPAGYHDFIPLSQEVSSQVETSDGMVLCNDWRKVISIVKRQSLGQSADNAVADVAALNDKIVCGYVSGLTLHPLAVAVRGDDSKPMRKVGIIKWLDQNGQIHYSGKLLPSS